MAKRGRPAKVKTEVTPKLDISTKLDTSNVIQLALNQVDFVARFSKIEASITQLVRGVDDFVNTANKVNQELAKRIQALESRCEDLEKKSLCKEGCISDLLDEVEKESEC